MCSELGSYTGAAQPWIYGLYNLHQQELFRVTGLCNPPGEIVFLNVYSEPQSSNFLAIAPCYMVAVCSPPPKLTFISCIPAQVITTSGDYNGCVWLRWLLPAQSGFREPGNTTIAKG